MNVGDLLDNIRSMDDQAFDQYWSALGTVIRIASRAKPPPAATPPAPQPADHRA